MRKCKWCGIKKPLRKHQRVCDPCKHQQFFKSKHWIWLESAAYKYGVQCWPDTTEDLVELLELRQRQTRYSGWYRVDGELKCSYEYELAHRYPASKGGKLIADNLVIMPAILNRKMGSNHGLGLELYKSEKIRKLAKKELRREFLRRYEMDKLEGFAKTANDTGSDFFSNGTDAFSAINYECERLCFGKIQYTYDTDDNDIWRDFEMMVNKYKAICNSDKAARAIDVNEALEMMDTEKHIEAIADTVEVEWVSDIEGVTGGDIAKRLSLLTEEQIHQMTAKQFRQALADADDELIGLSPLIEEQNRVWHCLQYERKIRNEARENSSPYWWKV
ncbi:hypothetical protein AB4452_04665 [Vibrio lentus]